MDNCLLSMQAKRVLIYLFKNSGDVFHFEPQKVRLTSALEIPKSVSCLIIIIQTNIRWRKVDTCQFQKCKQVTQFNSFFNNKAMATLCMRMTSSSTLKKYRISLFSYRESCFLQKYSGRIQIAKFRPVWDCRLIFPLSCSEWIFLCLNPNQNHG